MGANTGKLPPSVVQPEDPGRPWGWFAPSGHPCGTERVALVMSCPPRGWDRPSHSPSEPLTHSQFWWRSQLGLSADWSPLCGTQTGVHWAPKRDQTSPLSNSWRGQGDHSLGGVSGERGLLDAAASPKQEAWENPERAPKLVRTQPPKPQASVLCQDCQTTRSKGLTLHFAVTLAALFWSQRSGRLLLRRSYSWSQNIFLFSNPHTKCTPRGAKPPGM